MWQRARAPVYTSQIYLFKSRLNKPPPQITRRSVDPATRRSRCYADSLVDHLEDGVAHHHLLLTDTRRLRQLEFPSIELLVNDDRARAVPSQDLHGVATFGHEHEQGTRARLRLHPLSNDSSETLVAKPHVDGLEGDIDGQPVRDHETLALSAATTARSNSASKPASTRIAAPPTRSSSKATALGVSDISRANCGRFVDRTAFIQRYAVAALTPIRSATVFTGSPEVRTVSIRCSRCCAVYRLLMSTLLPASVILDYMGSADRLRCYAIIVVA